jgi:hypothetical protein
MASPSLPLAGLLVQPAQNLCKLFRRPFGNDSGIHPAQLVADCRHDLGSERGRGFTLVLIAHRDQQCLVCACAHYSARRAAVSRLTRCALSRPEGNAIHRQLNIRNHQTSDDQRAKRGPGAIAHHSNSIACQAAFARFTCARSQRHIPRFIECDNVNRLSGWG